MANEATTAGGEKMLSIVADQWRSLGVRASVEVIPATRKDREYEVKLPGPQLIGANAETLYQHRLHSRYAAAADNLWAEKNKGGYTNPRLDVLLDRLETTIDPQERVSIHRQLLQEGLGDVAVMLLYWQTVPVLALKGVRSHPVAPDHVAWDFFSWDKE